MAVMRRRKRWHLRKRRMWIPVQKRREPLGQLGRNSWQKAAHKYSCCCDTADLITTLPEGPPQKDLIYSDTFAVNVNLSLGPGEEREAVSRTRCSHLETRQCECLVSWLPARRLGWVHSLFHFAITKRKKIRRAEEHLVSSAFWVRLFPLVVYLDQAQLFLLPESSCVSETALKTWID